MSDRWLLVSDVDDTLLGDDEATRRFAEFYARNRDALSVVYNSGRFYDSLMQSVATTELPTPDGIIGGVGTEIRTPPEGAILDGWHRYIEDAWDHTTVLNALADFPGLELQPAEFQSPYKVSYYFPRAPRETLDALARRIGDVNVRANIVYSSELNLDILPARADKGRAAAYIARHWNYPPYRVMVSGDSGNDLALFTQGFRGIVVANAKPELKDAHHANTYQARAAYADGVLEGLAHWMNGEG